MGRETARTGCEARVDCAGGVEAEQGLSRRLPFTAARIPVARPNPLGLHLIELDVIDNPGEVLSETDYS